MGEIINWLSSLFLHREGLTEWEKWILYWLLPFSSNLELHFTTEGRSLFSSVVARAASRVVRNQWISQIRTDGITLYERGRRWRSLRTFSFFSSSFSSPKTENEKLGTTQFHYPPSFLLLRCGMKFGLREKERKNEAVWTMFNRWISFSSRIPEQMLLGLPPDSSWAG